MYYASSASRRVHLDLGGGQLGPMADSGLFSRCDHTLFVGAPACAYHNGGGRARDDAYSVLCPSDAQLALGGVEDLVLEAADEIAGRHGGHLDSLALSTACPTAFLGVDFTSIVEGLAQRGVVCLRRENCRILMPGMGGSYGSGRTSVPGFYDQLLTFMEPPDTRSDGPCGAAVVALGQPLDEDDELFSLGGGRPFAWVEQLGREVSFDALARASCAGLVLAVGEEAAATAQRVADKLGASCLTLPQSLRIEDIDAAYGRLEEACGRPIDVRLARDAAWQATDNALRVWDGCALELSLRGGTRPWSLVWALLDAGFYLESVQVERPSPPGRGPRGPQPAQPDDDYLALLEAYPHVERIVVQPDPEPAPGPPPGGAPRTRSGSVNFATSGPMMARPDHRQAQEPASWGYLAVRRCMDKLARAYYGEEA